MLTNILHLVVYCGLCERRVPHETTQGSNGYETRCWNVQTFNHVTLQSISNLWFTYRNYKARFN